MARKMRARRRAPESTKAYPIAASKNDREDAEAYQPDSDNVFRPEIPLWSPTSSIEATVKSFYNDDPHHEKPAKRKELFSDLLNALHSPSHRKYGSFASCEGVKHSQPLLIKSFHLEGAGELQVPLSAEDISKLRGGVCEKPQCKEIDASRITFVDAPEFLSNTIQPLAMHAVRKLGRHGAALPLAAQLHKLFLCDTSGEQDPDSGPRPEPKPLFCHHFTCQREAEEERGLFARLVLQIPTEDGYEGGGLVVCHRNSEKTFDCHLVSSVGFCYCVFYKDCKLQWIAIGSGTRVCMVFNLFRQASEAEALHREFVASKVREVESALQPWLSDMMKGKYDDFRPKLAIPLSYRYEDDELFFDGVKGDDKIVLEILKACRDDEGKLLLDLHLCLVNSHECHARQKHWSSTRCPDDVRASSNYEVGDPSALRHCHNGEGDEDERKNEGNYLDEQWTMESEESGFRRDVFPPHTDLDAFPYNNYPESQALEITFWTGEKDKLARAFGQLGLHKTEVVVAAPSSYADDYKERRKHLYHSWNERCRGWSYRAVLVLWPRELSVSVFCEVHPALALELLESTIKVTDPEFCGHLLRILCWCEANSFRVWGENPPSNLLARLIGLCTRAKNIREWRSAGNSESVTPTLLHVCQRASQLREVLPHAFNVLTTVYAWARLITYDEIMSQTNRYRNPSLDWTEIMSKRLAKEVASLIKVYEWSTCSSLILELVEQHSLIDGGAFVRLVKELYLIDLKEGGRIVAKAVIEVFEARVTELEQRTEPSFSWCQPMAKFPANAAIENFLHGPEETLVYSDSDYEDYTLQFYGRGCCRNRAYGWNLFRHGKVDQNGRSVVLFRKTKRHFEIAMERWHKLPDQLVASRAELRRIKLALRRAEVVSANTDPTVDGQHDVQNAGGSSNKNHKCSL